MQLDTLADQAAYMADFGVSVTWSRGGAAGVSFTAIFDKPSVDSATFHDAPPMIERKAQLMVRDADLPAGAGEGDRVVVAGDNDAWVARALYPDGTGITRVDLGVAT